MSFPVVTGTAGSITAGGLTIGWDTDSPVGDGPAAPGQRYVVDGMTFSWAIDVLPPVATPVTANFTIYQSSPDAGGGWLPFGIGDPIAVQVDAYTDLGSLTLWQLKGRVADVQGKNHQAGGIAFDIVVVDRLADLTSSNAPEQLVHDSNLLTPYDLFEFYDQLADDAGIDFDYQAGQSWIEPYWLDLQNTIDLTNVTTFEALSTAILHDIRVNADPNIVVDVHNVERYLTQQIDSGTTDPEAVARYRLTEWDPEGVDDLAGVLAFHWTGAQWVILTDPGYSGSGMVLSADQLARDVGAWKQTRDQATNTIEAQSSSTYDTGAKTVRARFDDLVETYGPNTRAVPCWYFERADAQAWAYELLIRRDQVQVAGYGFEQLTVAYETLTDDQLVLWADELFPVFGTQPLGRPFAVVDVPDHWKLADGPAIVGRVMGATVTLQAGTVRIQLLSRAVPPSAVDGVTFDDVAGFGPAQMTLNNIDPTITIDQLAVVGSSTI